jgi:hypothetical protein
MQDKVLPQSELTWAEAQRLWKAMLPEMLAGGMLGGVGAFVGGLALHRTVDQLEFLGVALVALSIAVSVWRHDVVWIKYKRAPHTFGHEVPVTAIVFHSPVRKEIAASVLMLAAVPFFLAATSTGVGTTLSSILGVPLTVFDAKGLIVGIPLGIGIVAVMLMVLAVIIWTTGRAVYNLGSLIFRRPRPGAEAGPDAALFFGGLTALGVAALAVYWIVRFHNVIFSGATAPFRAIWSWFT